MRVILNTEEGISQHPSPVNPIVVDTDELSPFVCDRLRGLVIATGFFRLPSEIGSPAPGARTHTIIVEDGPRMHRVSTLESKARPPLRELVDFVRAYGTRA